MQLAHRKAGLRGVYDKSVYLEKRQVMMQWYADYLDALEAGMTAESRPSSSSIKNLLSGAVKTHIWALTRDCTRMREE
jgi:hypothetical protein